mgnify:CR=1 FL=1
MMEFKKVLSAATVAVAFGLSAFAAQAANDVTLKVVGTINPAACTPTLPDGGVLHRPVRQTSWYNWGRKASR